MRYAIMLCALFTLGCDDEFNDARYADGAPWRPVMPLQPSRIPPGEMDARQWATFLAQSGIQADRAVKTFPTTWNGFSVDPTSDIRYMDFGAIVMMWVDANGTGTSDTTDFSIAGIPDAIVPSAQRSLPIIVMDNGLEAPARMIIDTDGTAFFQRLVISGSNLQYSTVAFTIGNAKGWVAGALVTYAK